MIEGVFKGRPSRIGQNVQRQNSVARFKVEVRGFNENVTEMTGQEPVLSQDYELPLQELKILESN